MPQFYKGVRSESGCKIFLDGEFDGENAAELPLRRDLVDHSTAFEWGYAGSGPAQTALALLAHALEDDERATALHQAYKDELVANFPYNEWLVSRAGIIQWAAAQSS